MPRWLLFTLQGSFNPRGNLWLNKFKLFLTFCRLRRPNPIPILAPPDHKKNQGSSIADDSEKVLENEKGESGTENIDHILDNMFVQRQPFEPAISIKDNQTLSAENSEDKVDQLNDGINVSCFKLSQIITLIFFLL